MDLVGTCPKGFWEEWLREGGCAGESYPEYGYAWWSRHVLARKLSFKFSGNHTKMDESDLRFYVVCHGNLRGWAPVRDILIGPEEGGAHCYGILRRSNEAVAITIPDPIPGFRGLRKRWWDRADETPFPDWKTP